MRRVADDRERALIIGTPRCGGGKPNSKARAPRRQLPRNGQVSAMAAPQRAKVPPLTGVTNPPQDALHKRSIRFWSQHEVS